MEDKLEEANLIFFFDGVNILKDKDDHLIAGIPFLLLGKTK